MILVPKYGKSWEHTVRLRYCMQQIWVSSPFNFSWLVLVRSGFKQKTVERQKCSHDVSNVYMIPVPNKCENLEECYAVSNLIVITKVLLSVPDMWSSNRYIVGRKQSVTMHTWLLFMIVRTCRLLLQNLTLITWSITRKCCSLYLVWVQMTAPPYAVNDSK